MSMKLCCLISAPLMLWGAGLFAQVAPAPPARVIVHHTFESDVEGWAGMGADVSVEQTRDAAVVKGAKGALAVSYAVKKGQLNAAVLGGVEGQLAKAASFRFNVMADYDATLAFALQEQNGGRYIAVIHAPKGKWQTVELAPSDFVRMEGADTPDDPNNRLDLDAVDGAAIADLSQLAVQSDNDLLQKLFNVKPGSHKLYLSDFTVSAAPLPGSFGVAAGDYTVDTLAHPQAGWIGIGGARCSVGTGTGLTGRALKLSYHTAPQSLVGAMRLIPYGKMSGVDRLTFDAAVDKQTKLLVQVEEVGGGKYNSVVDLSGGNAVQHLSLKLADMATAQDSQDKNGKLDVDQIKQVLFIDVAGLLTGSEGDNVLELNNLHFRGAK